MGIFSKRTWSTSLNDLLFKKEFYVSSAGGTWSYDASYQHLVYMFYCVLNCTLTSIQLI